MNTESTAFLLWFYLYEVVSEYAESVLPCSENKLKEYKRIRWIRQEYFAVHGEYAERHKTENWADLGEFWIKTKKSDQTLEMIEWAKKHLTLLSL